MSASRAPSPAVPGESRLADRVLPIVRALGAGREPDERLCVTSTRHQLRATAFKRTLAWAVVAEGRRIHNLRHTAACLWLARRVDPIMEQAWMGQPPSHHERLPAPSRQQRRPGRAGPAQPRRHAMGPREADTEPEWQVNSRILGDIALASDGL